MWRMLSGSLSRMRFSRIQLGRVAGGDRGRGAGSRLECKNNRKWSFTSPVCVDFVQAELHQRTEYLSHGAIRARRDPADRNRSPPRGSDHFLGAQKDRF